MNFLILPSILAARARSTEAYGPLAGDGVCTSMLWSLRPHPSDGRAALLIPDTPDDAGVGLSQAAYDALLTSEERAALVSTLPPDWTPEG